MSDLRKAAEDLMPILERWKITYPPCNGADWDKVEALRQALAQPEQHPVGTYEGVMETMLSLRKGTLEQQQIYTHMKDKLLYTAPPKREWVGLTHDEVYEFVCTTDSYIDFAKAIEAKLKEKNT